MDSVDKSGILCICPIRMAQMTFALNICFLATGEAIQEHNILLASPSLYRPIIDLDALCYFVCLAEGNSKKRPRF